MSNLQKFNQTLENIDREVEKLKEVSGIYQKIQQLTETQDQVIGRFEENNKILGENNDLQKIQQEKIANSLAEIKNASQQHMLDLQKLLDDKTSQIKDLQKEQQEKNADSLTEIREINKQNKIELSKLLEEKTDQIRKEGKDFYKDFEKTVKIKLDDNKYEIKRLIESERFQIKHIFEIEFAKNMKEIKKNIETEFEKQTQLLATNQKTIKISLWVLGGLILMLSALAVFKLWTT